MAVVTSMAALLVNICMYGGRDVIVCMHVSNLHVCIKFHSHNVQKQTMDTFAYRTFEDIKAHTIPTLFNIS